MLYIFGGLPGTGKSTLSKRLAQRLNAVYVRIDSIEQAIRNAGGAIQGPEGYSVGYALTADNLRMGHLVVVDSVNPIELTRRAWREVAEQAAQPFIEIEVICSNPTEHRHRVETRPVEIAGHIHPTWQAVVTRDYEAWPEPHLVLDTAGQSIDESFATLLQRLRLNKP